MRWRNPDTPPAAGRAATMSLFFVGTAVEITPIRSVDHIQVGKGVAGPITRKLQEEFFAITSGTKPDRHNWLTPVSAPVTAASR